MLNRLLTAVLMLLIASCASMASEQNYIFHYNLLRDSPGITLLDFRYGTNEMTRAPKWAVEKEEVKQQSSIVSYMPRGEELYVKWRINETRETYEKLANLRELLPADLTGRTVFFSLQSSRLNVYIVEPSTLPPNSRTGNATSFASREKKLIYTAIGDLNK